MSKAFANLFRFGRTPQPSNGDSNNASVPLRRSTSSAHHREPRNEAYRSVTPAVPVASSTSRHRTNAERTRPPLVEDETDAEEIVYPRQRAGRSQPSPYVGWQQPAPESIPLPPTRPSTARPSLDIPERGTFQDRPHTPATTRMRRRGNTNEFPMSDSEASGRSRSARPELRSPSRVEDRRHQRQYSTGAGIPPVPSLPTPFQSGLRDVSQVVTTSNKYPSAHGGSSDVWKGSWRSDNGFIEVAVKVVRVPVDNPEMRNMMNNRLRQALWIWQSLDSQYIISLYGVTEAFGPFTSLVTPWMGHGTLTAYLEGAGQNLSLAGRFRILINVAAGLSYLHSRSVVHGDLTGSNVLISSNGTARLTDMGLSIVMAEFHSMMQFTSTIRASVRYTAPEVYGHSENDNTLRVSQYSDVYSFGSIMLQTLTGRVPYYYVRHDPMVLLELYKGATPKRPTERWFTDSYWNFVSKCWSKVPYDRPGTQEILYFLQSGSAV